VKISQKVLGGLLFFDSHCMCYRSRLLINKFNARGTGHELERIFRPPKLIYDFLLVINTNLPHILHRFQVTVKFLRARGECLTLTISLRVIPANIAINDISLKTGFFSYISAAESIRVFSTTFT